VYSATTVNWPMIRRGRYKYIEHVRQSEHPVLFDLVADPLESVNRAGDPACREAGDTLAGLLRTMMRRPVLDVAVSR
jgi:arylsulfatase A-like enzyme